MNKMFTSFSLILWSTLFITSFTYAMEDVAPDIKNIGAITGMIMNKTFDIEQFRKHLATYTPDQLKEFAKQLNAYKKQMQKGGGEKHPLTGPAIKMTNNILEEIDKIQAPSSTSFFSSKLFLSTAGIAGGALLIYAVYTWYQSHQKDIAKKAEQKIQAQQYVEQEPTATQEPASVPVM